MSFGYGGFDAKVGHDLASGLGTIDPKTFPNNLCNYVAKTPRDIYFKSAQSTPTPTPANKSMTITCVKGKLTKKVTGINAPCPKGYKKK